MSNESLSAFMQLGFYCLKEDGNGRKHKKIHEIRKAI